MVVRASPENLGNPPRWQVSGVRGYDAGRNKEERLSMFVSVTRISGVPEPAIDRMVEGFRHGAQDLKAFPGFLGFELWRSAGHLEAVARWESPAALEGYRQSPAFQAHHGPSGGQPSAGSAEVVQFDAEVVV
jgi:heme-degrading monooxygenase HmoA